MNCIDEKRSETFISVKIDFHTKSKKACWVDRQTAMLREKPKKLTTGLGFEISILARVELSDSYEQGKRFTIINESGHFLKTQPG